MLKAPKYPVIVLKAPKCPVIVLKAPKYPVIVPKAPKCSVIVLKAPKEERRYGRPRVTQLLLPLRMESDVLGLLVCNLL